MRIDFSLIDIKDFLKFHGCKASSFCYEIEYLGGFYYPIFEDGYDVIFGSVTKSTVISIIEITASDTFVRNLFEIKNDVGLLFDDTEFKDYGMSLDLGRPLITINDYQLVFSLDSKNIISKISIRNIAAVQKNNLYTSRVARLNKIVEPDEALEIRSKLLGIWKLCKTKTELHHGDDRYREFKKEVYEINVFTNSRILSGMVYDQNVCKKYEFEYRISKYQKGIFMLYIVDIDDGSSYRHHYTFLDGDLIQHPGTDQAEVWVRDIPEIIREKIDKFKIKDIDGASIE